MLSEYPSLLVDMIVVVTQTSIRSSLLHAGTSSRWPGSNSNESLLILSEHPSLLDMIVVITLDTIEFHP